MIRPARLADLAALAALENRAFENDRLSRRQFRYMISKANAATLVEEADGVLRGYVLTLFHAGTSLARLYSIAVDPPYRGAGLARSLVRAAEREAAGRGCAYMRLEVRRDNPASAALFRSEGYRQFGTYPDYYEDHMEALRFEKPLLSGLRPDMARVPYYRQTLDFTCGPAALMMAMKGLEPEAIRDLDRRLELRLWRESTTIYMTSGHGGCGPFGLALSAHRRGLDAEVFVNDPGALFVDSVRSEEKKEVIRLVQEDFVEELAAVGIPIHYRRLMVPELRELFDAGAIPVVLISSYRIYHEKVPHWVVVTGFDDRFVYVHDPYVHEASGRSETDCFNMPIPQRDFERMARYGKAAQRAVIVLRRPEE